MRKRVFLFIVSLCVLPAFITGCSKEVFKPGQDTNIKESQTQMKGSSKSKSAENQNISGVILDTVVDVFSEPDLKSDRLTQALFNQKVNIIEESELWTKVKVLDGHIGWVRSKFVEKESTSKKSGSYKYRIVVTAKTKNVLSGTKSGTVLKDVVMGTEFYSKDKTEGGYEVMLPGNRQGWIEMSGTIQLPAEGTIPRTSAADFIVTASKLKGTSYLWGGVSAWGIDGAGLVYISSRVSGVSVSRALGNQFEAGEKIALEAAKPGDLVFFSTNDDLQDVSHVGIYLGDQKFIHASKSKGSVITSALTEDYFKRRLVGIRRIFN